MAAALAAGLAPSVALLELPAWTVAPGGVMLTETGFRDRRSARGASVKDTAGMDNTSATVRILEIEIAT